MYVMQSYVSWIKSINNNTQQSNLIYIIHVIHSWNLIRDWNDWNEIQPAAWTQ